MYLWRNLKPAHLLAVLSPHRGAPGKGADTRPESAPEAAPQPGETVATPRAPSPPRRGDS
ncbi:hypothetical protein [Caenispirillum bisanense]|uniref:Uncharacterized protein n=1 Tax=Caenispirillum bisanense TaxID=414052 RepID=A0A286GWK2_9PROT|nr:hypothetical protein [Caenispirillum bisanense]SOD99862.1 hypothetical protein SAMN05421508_11046 [Caenispirillum bisanense]